MKGKQASVIAFKQVVELEANFKRARGEKSLQFPHPHPPPPPHKNGNGKNFSFWPGFLFQKHPAKTVEKRDSLEGEGALACFISALMQQSQREPFPGRPKAKEWFKKWITHLGPILKWRIKEILFRFWSQWRGNWESVRREKVKGINVSQHHVMSFLHKGRTIYGPYPCSSPSVIKKRTSRLMAPVLKSTYSETHCVCSCVQSPLMNLELYSFKTDTNVLF